MTAQRDVSLCLDAVSLPVRAQGVAASATAAEAAGFDGWYTGETGSDAFIAAAMAGRSTSRIRVGTGVAIAFARNPMTVAYSANDVQAYADGRFLLGLGTQIKPHVAHRFSMPWSNPVARMREFIAALHAIWDSWFDGVGLDFRGDFYQHTLMTPMFFGERHDHGRPPIALAAVGPQMTRLAGEQADAMLVHAFCTERFLRERTLPWLGEGRDGGTSSPREVAVLANVFVIVDDGSAKARAGASAARKQLAFYGSTPAYRTVLELHGWGDAQDELQELARAGRWDDMADVIDDEMLAALAIVAPTPKQAGEQVARRFGGAANRVLIAPTWQPDADELAAVRDGIELIDHRPART